MNLYTAVIGIHLSAKPKEKEPIVRDTRKPKREEEKEGKG